MCLGRYRYHLIPYTCIKQASKHTNRKHTLLVVLQTHRLPRRGAPTRRRGQQTHRVRIVTESESSAIWRRRSPPHRTTHGRCGLTHPAAHSARRTDGAGSHDPQRAATLAGIGRRRTPRAPSHVPRRERDRRSARSRAQRPTNRAETWFVCISEKWGGQGIYLAIHSSTERAVESQR